MATLFVRKNNEILQKTTKPKYKQHNKILTVVLVISILLNILLIARLYAI
jgi:preprotein translocase subunit SecE